MKFLIEDSNKIDLHIHTVFSDGVKQPLDIILEAKEKGLEYIAFTDHNEDEARFEYSEAYIEQKYGVKVIAGCELDVFFKGKLVHLLAYDYVDAFNDFFLPKIQKNFGVKKLSLKKACRMIHFCLGYAVIAHPLRYGDDAKELLNEIIKEVKIDGVECIHSSNTQEEVDYLLELCNKNDLMVTAGSDFHKKGRTVREDYKQNNIDELPVLNSTIEEQLIKARQKYPANKR